MKILSVFIFIFSLNSFAVDICSFNYLGVQNSIKESQFARMIKVGRLEKLTSKLRNFKAQKNIVEIERYYTQQIIRTDIDLFEGNHFLAQKEWQTFFREFETNFYRVKKLTEIIQTTKSNRNNSLSELYFNLNSKFDNDAFGKEILENLFTKNIKNISELEIIATNDFVKSSKRLGRDATKYRIICEHMDYVSMSKNCDQICREKLSLLKKNIGVGAKDEKLRFPLLKDLSTPKLSVVKNLINSNPHAYEMMILKEALMELKAIFLSKLSVPSARAAFANSLYKIINKVMPNNKITLKILNKLVSDTYQIKNHMPILHRVIKTDKTLAERLNKLKTQSLETGNKDLLVTFARWSSRRSVKSWDELKEYALNNDTIFFEKMMKAQSVAKAKGELTTNVTNNPLRGAIFILGGFLGYQYLNLSFYIDGESNDELEELQVDPSDINTEVIELLPDAIDKDKVIIHISNESDFESLIDQSSILMEAVLD